jgi:hypothetical protein
MWKEAAMVYFKVLFWHFLAGPREPIKHINQDTRSLGEDLKPGPSNY